MTLDSQFERLYAAARAARSQAQWTARRTECVLRESSALWQVYQQQYASTERVRELCLSGQRDRVRYSRYARLQARLASMPVIEQAKGILMAQCGWTADQAFDALRRASQRENVRVRDLSARIVAHTAKPPANPADAVPERGVTPLNSSRPGEPDRLVS